MNAKTSPVTIVSASLALLAGPLGAQSTIRVSVASAGAQANAGSARCSVSAEGTCIAFESDATNLVAGDANSSRDIFVRDRPSGLTVRVSVDSAGQEGIGGSGYPSISADGRFVAFASSALTLVAGDTNNATDIFVHDRQSGTTERVSLGAGSTQADGGSAHPAISADGRYAAFLSSATNLVAGDTNSLTDVFVRDRLLGQTERVSVSTSGTQGNGISDRVALSADGSCVSFRSLASSLVSGDTNLARDIFVRDRAQGTTERVSVSSSGAQANSESFETWVSDDGRYVTFASSATNLVAGDTNAHVDIFVRDRQLGSTERVSVSSSGLQPDGDCHEPSISDDGRFVAFESSALNLVYDFSFPGPDIFVHDRQLGTTECASRTSDGASVNGSSVWASISGDGRFVGFLSGALGLVAGDTNGADDIFLRDRGAALPEQFCMGDGSAGACPCANWGFFGGCDNSAQTGGAALDGTGQAALLGDTLVLNSSGQLPSSLGIVLQGDAAIAGIGFGDGIRCVGGVLRRLYSLPAVSGSVTVPVPGGPSISARSAALGDVIPAGGTRVYQIYYRDPSASFCPAPQGNTWNVTSALSVQWGW